MNIICYMNTLSGGGAERVMSVLANNLSRRGHQVTVLTDYSTPNEYPLDREVGRVVLDGVFDPSRKGDLKQSLKRVPRIRDICRERKADAIVSFIRQANFRAIMSTRFLQTKNLISVRIDPKIGYRGKATAMLAKLLYPLADGCVFQTQEARAFFAPSIQKKSRIVFNPVSDAFFKVTPAPMQEKRIVACGRLDRQKRFDLLIDAFHKVCGDFPEYTLEIYGVGGLQEALQQQIDCLGRGDRIKLMGRSHDMPGTLKKASLFVLSSDYEGLPNALMEAMVLGLPVVSTDCSGGGARALIEDGVDGMIVPCGDVDALAEALRENLTDPATAKVRGEKASEKAKNFSTEKIAAQWESYIKQIVGK